MNLQDYLRILRKRWKIIPIVTLVVVAVAAAVTVLMPKTYESKVQFFVSTVDTSDNSQLAQGSTFLQQRVKSYSQLLKAPVVLQAVVKDQDLNTTPGKLADQVDAVIPPDSVLINTTVKGHSPHRAHDIAAAISKRFPKAVSELEQVSSKKSPVKVTVTQPPTLETTPISPRPIRNLGLSVILGLLLGLGAAGLRHVLDNKLRTKDDIEGLVEDLTVIGMIPFDGDASKHPLLLEAGPHSSRAESFRSLRTNLAFVDAATDPRTIVMTSTVAGEGKTTTTANLALVLAQSEASVCLVEGDLRRPRLLEYLGMEGAVGLTDVLIGRMELTDVLQPFGQHELAVLGAGQTPPNPSELLGSPAMRQLLQELSKKFDYVLIDAPPLLPVTDAVVLSTLAGGAVLVAGTGLVTKDQFSTALESLEAVNGRILGVVLNRIPRNAHAAGYYDYRYEHRLTYEGADTEDESSEIDPEQDYEPQHEAEPSLSRDAV